MAWWRRARETVVASAVVFSCGGQSVRQSEESGDGKSGDTGSGGTSGSSSAGRDGGRGASGTAGATTPTPGTCSFEGATFEVGAGRTEDDGCTICTCTTSGMLCDSDACPATAECAAIRDDYELLVLVARSCDPANQLECNGAVPLSLPCGCLVPVIATPEIAALVQAWIERRCRISTSVCLPCPSPPEPPYGCSADGLCVMR
jgi:hypothetical protein